VASSNFLTDLLKGVGGAAGGALAGNLVNQLFAPDPNDFLDPLLDAQARAEQSQFINCWRIGIG